MKSTKCLLLGLAWIAACGCGPTNFSNYFLPTEPEAAEAMMRKAPRLPPYTSSEAQSAVIEASVHQFWQDAKRVVGADLKELYVGVGPSHIDPESGMMNRLASGGNSVRPLSSSKRVDARTNGANPPAPGRVYLAIESVDFADPYTAAVQCQWSTDEGAARTFIYQFQYASRRWNLIR